MSDPPVHIVPDPTPLSGLADTKYLDMASHHHMELAAKAVAQATKLKDNNIFL